VDLVPWKLVSEVIGMNFETAPLVNFRWQARVTVTRAKNYEPKPSPSENRSAEPPPAR
jgi:hypothetical protein